MNLDVLARYRDYIGPRYASLEICFAHLAKKAAPIIVELGASRSFVDGSQPGVMSDAPKYWHPAEPAKWDWGAGSFSRVCAEIIAGTHAQLHSVDPSEKAMTISKTITAGLGAQVLLHQDYSTQWLKGFGQPIDLVYMDHHETCEEGARLHRTDAEIILEPGRLADDARILIDDVHVEKNARSKGLGALMRSVRAQKDIHYGKGKYSIPYFQEKGWEIVYEGYQVVMKRSG